MFTKLNKKAVIAVAIVLLLPLVAIGFFAFQRITGATEFDDVHQVRLVLPDKTEYLYTDRESTSYFASLMSRSSVISTAVRDITEETPASLYLDDAKYDFYLSRSVSGCMIRGEDGRFRLMNEADATSLIIRDEMVYLYADSLLPRLTISSGDDSYSVQPDAYQWSFKKEDGKLYEDHATAAKQDSPTYNLLADFENSFAFSLEPSQYSLSVYRLDGAAVGEEIPVNSFEELSFEQDTLLGVNLQARWSQADNMNNFGEASYRFAVLYDVPAQVELIGADETSTRTVHAGDWIVFRALYTNENESLQIRSNCTADNLDFYYDPAKQSSYAVVAIGRENPEGTYYVSVTSGETVTLFNLKIQKAEETKILSLQLSDDDYQNYLTPERLTELEERLTELRAQADPTPMFADTGSEYGMFVFGLPCAGNAVYPYGSDLLFSNSNKDDPGWYQLNGILYEAAEGTDVRSVQAGTVLFTGYMGAYGNAVIVSHGCGVCSYYFHLADINVTAGERVGLGKIIGSVGRTGFTNDSACLHFALSAGNTYFRP
ncbi:MAG: M23 family metallopeptidase [Clostridia bacterium]|nr:M23 family metallopeptidase [Clostridia bacterium]